jgi:hypothetical protein
MLEIGGKKKWLEEDDMVCKLCDPDEVISKEVTPPQQSASEKSGSEESGSEESGSEESAFDSTFLVNNNGETSILTESVTVEKSAPSIASPNYSTKLKCTYSKCI